jgi:LysM repeat protein
VQAGENLFRIAMKYGTTVEAIVAANDLPNENAIQEGQALLIPAGSPPANSTPGPTDGDTYVVQPGDTLFSIAQRFNTTVETLAALNGIAPPYTIEVGQELIVSP